ncbi:endonuclease domain-containing protein [Sphingomonas cavernae]|nr:endonuclease domain-containing protein [Sphingomonas cavernae]
MWRLLRDHFPEARFRRQVPLRHFIADFASHRAKLVIEVDGGQHGGPNDEARTAIIEAEGYRVIRFWNPDVLGNAEGVSSLIAGVLHERHPHPTLPHQGGGLEGAHS